ncbi:MAG: ribosome maturation factor RimP [Propioniciclava sp.]
MKESAMSNVVGPVLEQCGLELDRLEIMRAGKRSVVRVFVDGDGPEGTGPSLDEIAEATRAVSLALDESDAPGSAPYTLEVSSRGTDRPLTEERHYRRNRDRLVKITTADDEVTGRIVDVAAETVTIANEGGERALALADITRAVIQVELRKQLPADAEGE